MATSDEELQKLPAELLSSFREARAAIAQQRYTDALVILQKGLDRKYDPAALDGLSLVEHFLGLVWILEFNLQQTNGIDWKVSLSKFQRRTRAVLSAKNICRSC
jgi:hypothetical protein